MTGTFCNCVCSTMLVAVLGIAAILSAPAVDTSSASTKTGSSVQQRPDLSAFADWNSVRDKTICPAQVAFNRHLQVLQVWCADGVEGQIFEARGQLYVCKSMKYTIVSNGNNIDVLGGCVARLNIPTRVAALELDSN